MSSKANVLPDPAKWWQIFDNRKKFLFIFSVLWLMVASLEFFQDIVSAHINNNALYLSESLSFKIYWLLYIPFTGLLILAYRRVRGFSGKLKRGLFFVAIVVCLSLLHLLVFSLILSWISSFIHENRWSLSFLLSMKLSTRLYITLCVYLVISILLFWRSSIKEYKLHLTVKSGNRSVLVPVENIEWIRSSGAYVQLKTKDQSFTILDSLKSLTSQLDPTLFQRIHRSTILNLSRIEEMRSRLNGDYDLLLKDGTVLRLSRNYAVKVKKMIR